jgi:autotransporter-associated beta strand protein
VFSNTDTGNNTVIRNFNLQGANTGLNSISSVIRNSTIAGAVTTVNKREAGTWVVSGTNTYSGPTNVFGGTLFINGNNSAVTSLTTVNSGGKLGGTGTLGGGLQVNNGGGLAVVVNGTNPVKLTVNGDVTLNNTSTLSVSTQGVGFNQPSYVILEYTGTLSGTLVPQDGYLIEHNESLKQLILTVDPNYTTPYQAWIDSYFPGSTDPAVIGVSADPDWDGLKNSLEYVLGTAPNSGSQTSLPESQKIGSNLVFTFDQVVEAINAGFVPTVEYSPSLAAGSWSTATVGMTSVVNEGSTDAVTVTIPIPGGATKLFARLKVTTP